QKQLTSGLTTVFVATLADRDAAGGALRVEIRYELWDETYLVQVLDLTGRKQELTFHSFDQLVDWWSRAHLRLGHLADAPASLRLKLELVPFSAGEEADAKRWLAHAIGEAAGPAAAPRGGASAGEASGGNILDLVIGTSMRRKAVQAWQWTVRLERR
ncbi:MAG TPA: hypothetical protein VN605_08955, partial [Thermoanaerobaculia bacterium]|nr:hypothetical protein [Thermoanaerobaculia bacterium]